MLRSCHYGTEMNTTLFPAKGLQVTRFSRSIPRMLLLVLTALSLYKLFTFLRGQKSENVLEMFFTLCLSLIRLLSLILI